MGVTTSTYSSDIAGANADVSKYTQINPLDIDGNISIGVTLPLMNEGTFDLSYTFKEQVKSNIINVLLTEPGERVFLPNFGVGIRQLLFENNPDTTYIKEKIDNQLKTHVVEIELMDVEVSFDKNRQILYIKIVYSNIYSGEKDAIEVNIGQNNTSNKGVALGESVVGYQDVGR